MSYTTDFYVAKLDGTLSFLFTVSGSSAPWNFENADTLSEVYDIVGEISSDKETYISYTWSNPWENSKVSDDCVIFEMVDHKKWKFWKHKDSVKVWKDTGYKKEELKNTLNAYFVDDMEMAYDNDELDPTRVKLFTLPQMKK